MQLATPTHQRFVAAPPPQLQTYPLTMGTTPYYAIELLRSRHSSCLAFFWFLCFCAFSVLLFQSNEMQYDCFSFCETTDARSCSLLHSSNGSDTTWRTSASSCFDAGTSTWPSEGSFTNISAQDVIPQMSSTTRRIGRLILRYGIGDYSYVAANLFGPSNRPQLQSLQLFDQGMLLPTPAILDALTLTNVYYLALSSDNDNAAIIFELPVGYLFPTNTQQLQLVFPGGAPLVSYGGGEAGPVQLTFATTKPLYVVVDVLIRYGLLLATIVVLVVVMSRHALSSTEVYPIFDPEVPISGSGGWFGWIAVVKCANRRETLNTIWRRQPKFIKSSFNCLVLLLVVCDPLAAAFATTPSSSFLAFWSLHLMPWFRLTFMVGTTSWLLACMITCGDRGHMYAASKPLTPSASEHRSNRVVDVTILAPSRRSARRILIALAFFPSSLYLCSVIAASLVNQPSEPAAFGTGHGFRMMGSVIGMEFWMPITLLSFFGFFRRTLYARFPTGVDVNGPDDLVATFGVPSCDHSGRAFVIAVRFLLPYCVWTSLFMTGAYFGTLVAVTSLLPSYYNGHLVEVLMCVLLAWTIAFTLVPVRKPLVAYPPRPNLYPPPPQVQCMDAAQSNGSVVDASSQQLRSIQALPQQVPNNKEALSVSPRAADTPLLLTSVGQNNRSPVSPVSHLGGNAAQYPLLAAYGAIPQPQISFDSSLPLWCQIPWTTAYFVNLNTGLAPNCGYAFFTESQEMTFDTIQTAFREPQPLVHQPNVLAVKRSFLCWETAVRALNMSQEAYNSVEGGRDISHLATTEEYEQSCCESCIVNRCCCCCFGGCGCCGGGEDVVGNADDDDDEVEDSIPAADVLEEGLPPRQGSTYGADHHAVRMSRSSRRFTEAGAVADASRQSVAKRRRADSQLLDSRQQSAVNEDDSVNYPATATESDVSHSVSPLARQDTAPMIQDDDSARTINPSTSHNNLTSDSPPKSTAASSTSPLSNGPGTRRLVDMEDMPKTKNQIDVTRYGYELIKVVDVFGVRVIVAATPPGTTGRHAHLCISFRGTVNLRNALTDANARMLEHPEILGGAEVHRGFWLAFEKLLPALVTTLQEFFFGVSSCEWGSELTRVVCTGHSLGGALAMLCAYSAARGTLLRDVFSRLSSMAAATSAPPTTQYPLAPQQYFQGSTQAPTDLGGAPSPRVRCYTFGSPRLGNALLSFKFNQAVPDTYRIINENDIVARVGLCWQEHTGREVRIDRDGDVVIEGTYLEQIYTLTKGVGSSIKNHYLMRYGNSIDNCLCARNLNMLSPDCCSFLMVHVGRNGSGNDGGQEAGASTH